MSTVPLPEQPNLGQLRNQARELQRAVRAGDPQALGLLARHHDQAPPSAQFAPSPQFALSAAQTVLARHYGFASWARLRRHVEVITERSWVLPEPTTTAASLADEFLRLACLNFTDDTPVRRVEAARLLAGHPDLPGTELAVAAACADVGQVRRLLLADPTAAARGSGPFGWSPLMYQAYARHDPNVTREATVQTAELLLDAGADPNDGRFFSGLPTPFTVLTGAFGGGERDQPPHPQQLSLARVLLSAGADPNDGQALYNRMFAAADDHLKLLFEYGLGHGDGGPWHRLLGDQLESPQAMLRRLLGWAVSHDQRERVALLAAHGVDVVSPLLQTWRSLGTRSSTANAPTVGPPKAVSPEAGSATSGTPANDGSALVAGPPTPIEVALLDGNQELAQQLRRLGAREPRLDPVEVFIAAVLAGDVEAVAATPAAVIGEARTARPGLIVWAASQGKLQAIDLLVANGFNINTLGRSDTPIEQPWETALHATVANGDLAVAQHLLDLGADPTLLDKRFDSTPLEWARYFDHPELIALLQSPSV